METVEVLCFDGSLSEYISAALARLAVSRGVATVERLRPYCIRLIAGYTKCPKSFTDGNRNTVTTVTPKTAAGKALMRAKMHTADKVAAIEEFFKKVDPENGGDGLVWAVMVKATGDKVIIQKGMKDNIVRFPMIKPGEPTLLNELGASFEDIRTCSDIKTFVKKDKIRLMTHEEASVVFDKLAAELDMDVDDLVRQAQNQPDKSQPLKETTRRPFTDMESDLPEAEPINPKVQHLMTEIAPSLKAGEALPVDQVLRSLKSIEDTLSHDDLQFVFVSSGRYPSIKNWAAKKIAAVTAETVE